MEVLEESHLIEEGRAFLNKELFDDQVLERVGRWRSGLELGGTKLKLPAQKLRAGRGGMLKNAEERNCLEPLLLASLSFL